MSALDISNIKILLIEDNAFMRRILVHVLQGLHVKEIVEATDGADAFEKLKNYEPDVILVDWEMEKEKEGLRIKYLEYDWSLNGE